MRSLQTEVAEVGVRAGLEGEGQDGEEEHRGPRVARVVGPPPAVLLGGAWSGFRGSVQDGRWLGQRRPLRPDTARAVKGEDYGEVLPLLSHPHPTL